MAEIQPPEGQINGGAEPVVIASSEAVASKRQRRPSVRLGDIGGDQPYDSHTRRSSKHWRISMDHRRDSDASGKSSKTRHLTNLSSGSGGGEFQETLDGEEKEGNLDSVTIGSWRIKDSKKRISMSTKRIRSNWISSKLDEGGGDGGNEKYSGGKEADESFRDFDMDNSGSPLKEQSPNNSLENLAAGGGHGSEREVLYSRRPSRAMVSEELVHNDGVGLSEPSDTDAMNWMCREDKTSNGVRMRCGEDVVRIWLDGLGLSRYAPVFEIHEVDEEVLPMLTIEDLKDMGISAVGSRRKMYSAIQRLGKGFT